MTKKTRLIILTVCAVLFFIITPYILLYSLGYRVDFETKKIVATGGLYIKAQPQGATITIDSKISNKTSMFFNSVFVQNLLPKRHTLKIEKDGYYNYEKNLDVRGNEVAKLEHVVLMKKNISFELLKDAVDYFSFSPDENSLLTAGIKPNTINIYVSDISGRQSKAYTVNVKNGSIQDTQWSDDGKTILLHIGTDYYRLNANASAVINVPILASVTEAQINPQNNQEIFFIKNKNLYSNLQTLPLLKNVAAYQLINQDIIWLSYDGFLYDYATSSKTQNKITSQVFAVKQNSSYTVTTLSGNIFVKEHNAFFKLNQGSKILESFYNPVEDIKVSPDGQKVVYCNDHEVLLSFLNSDDKSRIFLNRFSGTIGGCHWLNNEYLIFTLGDKIIISEIDNRGNINTNDLSQQISLADGKSITIKNPKIFLRQQDKKVYILSERTLLFSERLIP